MLQSFFSFPVLHYNMQVVVSTRVLLFFSYSLAMLLLRKRMKPVFFPCCVSWLETIIPCSVAPTFRIHRIFRNAAVSSWYYTYLIVSPLIRRKTML